MAFAYLLWDGQLVMHSSPLLILDWPATLFVGFI